MATTPLRGESARHLTWGMLAIGLTLQVVGCISAVVQVPRTELGASGPVETGDRVLMLAGLLTFGLGGVLSLVSVVAFGVLLGMRAHAQE